MIPANGTTARAQCSAVTIDSTPKTTLVTASGFIARYAPPAEVGRRVGIKMEDIENELRGSLAPRCLRSLLPTIPVPGSLLTAW